MPNSKTAVRMLQIRGGSSSKCRETLVVFMEEIYEFGEKLYDNVISRLTEYRPLYTGHCFGQNACFRSFVIATNKVCLKDAVEVLVHIAYDIYKDGEILLWSRAAVTSRLWSLPSPLEFFVGGIPGYGNFVFSVPKSCVLTRCPAVKHIKFYSSLAKYFHAQSNSPFSTSSVANDLLHASLGHALGFKKISLKKMSLHLQDVFLVEEYVKAMTDLKYFARCELIMNVKVISSCQETLEAAYLEATEAFKFLDLTSCCKGYLISDMRQLLKTNLMPCLRLLQIELELACKFMREEKNL